MGRILGKRQGIEIRGSTTADQNPKPRSAAYIASAIDGRAKSYNRSRILS